MKNLVDFFFEIGTLRRIKRGYKVYGLIENAESVAEHSHRAQIIAYILAKKEGADATKTMMMAAFHDMPETRTDDIDWLQKQYVEADEEKALDLQLDSLGELANEIKEILKEYKKRESIESKIAKDADNIEYVMSLKEFELTGNKEATRRLNSENTATDKLYTDTAKEIVKLIKKSNPTDWTISDLEKTHIKYKVN